MTFSSDKLLDSPSNWPCMIVNTGFSFSNQAAGEFPLAGEDNLCAQGAFECQRQPGIASLVTSDRPLHKGQMSLVAG